MHLKGDINATADRQRVGGQLMSRTTTADPSLIPDIEAFKERVDLHIHEGGIPTDQAKDLAVQA